MHWTDDSVCTELAGFSLYKPEHRQRYLLHVLGQVHRQLLPCRECLSAEAARLILRLLCSLVVALLDFLPCGFRATSLLYGSFALDLGLRVLVFSYEMLKEIVPAITLVMASFYITCPPFELPVTFVFMTNPISFALEHFWSWAFIPSARKGLHILMDMLSPVGWLHKPLFGITEAALKLRWKVGCRRHRDILREALGIYSTLTE